MRKRVALPSPLPGPLSWWRFPQAVPPSSSIFIISSPCHWPSRTGPPVPNRVWVRSSSLRNTYKPCHCSSSPNSSRLTLPSQSSETSLCLYAPRLNNLPYVAHLWLFALVLKPPTSFPCVISVWIWQVPGARHAHLLRVSLRRDTIRNNLSSLNPA